MSSAPLGLLTLLLLSVTTGRVAAQEVTPCGAALQAAVASAAEATGLRLTAARCPGRLLVVRISPEHASPLDVELRRPAGHPFRRAGELGVSPIVQVADFRRLPAAQRDAFEALVHYLGRGDTPIARALGEPMAEAAPILARGLHWPLFLFAGLLALWLAGVRSERPHRGGRRVFEHPRRTCIGLFVLAATLRLAFGLWGPLHVNGQGPMWVSGALDPVQLTSYGPGYAELFGWAGALARPDLAIFTANALLGALLAPLLYRIGERVGLRRSGALAAALALTLDPVSIRICASESYFVVLSGLVLLTCLAVASAAHRMQRGARRRALLSLLAAGLFAAQAARTHPVAWLPVALTPLFVLGAPATLRRRIVLGVVACAAVGGLSVLLSGSVILDGLAHARSMGGGGRPQTLLDMAPLLSVLAIAALLLRRRARPAALATVAFAYLAVDLMTRQIYVQSALWMASFDRLYLPAILLGAAAYWPRRLQRPLAVAMAAAAVALLLGVSGPKLRERTTEQLEYRFLAWHLARAPAGCWVTWVDRAGRRVLSLPAYAVPADASGARGPRITVRQRGSLGAAALRAPCLLYVHASICQSAEGRDTCTRVEEGARLDPLARTTLPARPSYEHLGYDAERVRVELFRVRRE